MSDARKTSDSIPDLAGALVKKLVPREAILLSAFAVLLLGAGGAATWAGNNTIHEAVDAGNAAEAVQRVLLEQKVLLHIADEARAREAQVQASQRMEAKQDRADARMEQLMQAVYELKGQRPPPPPPLLLPDAGSR